jgi:hypothetical protein
VAARQFSRAALFGAATILRREQLLAARRRQRRRLFGDQAELASQPDCQLTPPGCGPQGGMGDLSMNGHVRILAELDRLELDRGGAFRCPGR